MTNWHPTAQDVDRIREAVESRKNLPFVRDRINHNVDVDAYVPSFSRDKFWWAMMDCLLTTRQPANEGSHVYKFSRLSPYPLALAECEARETAGSGVEKFIEESLRAHRIGFVTRIAKSAKFNLGWLRDNWKTVEQEYQALALQRSMQPNLQHAKRERDAAHLIDPMKWFGPKQSRNLWQLLGLTRYEIPIDRRVTHWINKKNLSVQIDPKKLSSADYYESTLDYLQAACDRAGTLPCVFDAVAYLGGSND